MGTHLYLCDSGGPMTLGIDGTPPRWATCPVCTKSLECERCPGAQLQGEAPAFTPEAQVVYRCAAGHQRVIAVPPGEGRPESTHCPDCDGMLLPIDASAPA